jgi:hypothetical protein
MELRWLLPWLYHPLGRLQAFTVPVEVWHW